jgi:hypothetical protein
MAQLDLSHIPLFYRVFLLWFEPFAAWNGSQMALRTPNEYLKVYVVQASAVFAWYWVVLG